MFAKQSQPVVSISDQAKFLSGVTRINLKTHYTTNIKPRKEVIRIFKREVNISDRDKNENLVRSAVPRGKLETRMSQLDYETLKQSMPDD